MYLSFSLEPGKNFVIDDEKVERVIQTDAIFAVPGCKPGVLGIIEYRGILIGVFELRHLFPDLFSARVPLPHLILFRGAETLNAFPAEAVETIATDYELQDSLYQNEFVWQREVVHRGKRYWELNFEAIEPYFNIP